MRFAVVACALALAGCISDSPFPDTSGWRPLFNGRNLDGWTAHFADQAPGDADATAMFCVEHGMIHAYCHAPPGVRVSTGFIQTDQDYGDVVIQLEYRWGVQKYAPRADQPRDSGLQYLNYGASNSWPRSVENQIQEGDTGDVYALSTQVASTINPQNGGYLPAEQGGQAATLGAFDQGKRIAHQRMNEVPGWNTVEVVLRGDSAVQVLNGVVVNRIHDIRQWDGQSWVRLDHGRVSIQAEAAEYYIRNVRVRAVNAYDPQ